MLQCGNEVIFNRSHLILFTEKFHICIWYVWCTTVKALICIRIYLFIVFFFVFTVFAILVLQCLVYIKYDVYVPICIIIITLMALAKHSRHHTLFYMLYYMKHIQSRLLCACFVPTTLHVHTYNAGQIIICIFYSHLSYNQRWI